MRHLPPTEAALRTSIALSEAQPAIRDVALIVTIPELLVMSNRRRAKVALAILTPRCDRVIDGS
jgi:hypothetical protein